MTVTGDDTAIESRIQEALFPGEEAVQEEVEELEEDSEDTLEGEQVDEVEDDEDDEEAEETDEIDPEAFEIAHMFGLEEGQIDFDEDGELVFIGKVDGDLYEFPAREALKSLQLSEHVNRKSEEVSEMRRQADAEIAESKQAFVQKLEEVDTVIGLLEKQMIEPYEGLNWDQLKMEDPGRFAALQLEYQTHVRNITDAKQAIQDERQQQFAQMQQEQMRVMEEIRDREMDALLDAHPEWHDEDVFQQDAEEMANFLQDEYRFTQDEILQIYDHRLVNIIKDAQAYRSAKAVAQEKMKKPVPKFQKSTAARAQGTSKARAAKEKRAKFRKSGSSDDLAAILLDRM